jgi:hypothetical protein
MNIKHARMSVAAALAVGELTLKLDSEFACTFAGLATEIGTSDFVLQGPGGGIRQQRRTAVAPTKGVPFDCCRIPA